MQTYLNRHTAGRMLADLLPSMTKRENTLVLALPRGGVPIGYELATALCLPWDIFLVAKLRVPGQTELALGALAWEDICVFNQSIIQSLHISQTAIHEEIDRQKQVLQERNRVYRQGLPVLALRDKTIILCDDGLATGATMRAAAAALRLQNPAQIIVAVPVAAADSCQQLSQEVDEVVCLQMPQDFHSVSEWYQNFAQVSEQEVVELLQQSKH
jgi:putative phosphoribosyl transferase